MPKWWKTRTACSYVLWPFSLLYRLGRWVHKRVQLAGQYWAGVPVISVGNLMVGGTGKTPLIMKLAAHYAQKGEQVAILSRGYGGSQKQPYRLMGNESAALVGDEPLMMFKKLKPLCVDVWVGRSKVDLAKRAERFGATLMLVDDGFQHVKLGRNVDIVVVDGGFGFGNEFCLPAGPLREPVSALKRAENNNGFAVVLNDPEPHKYYQLRAYRLRAESCDLPLKSGKYLAFAGIGRPEKVFESLKDQGLKIVETVGFEDHYVYRDEDVGMLQDLATDKGLELLTTAKDAVKLPRWMKVHVVDVQLVGGDWENILADLSETLA